MWLNTPFGSKAERRACIENGTNIPNIALVSSKVDVAITEKGSIVSFFFFFLIYYLFLAVLGLRLCARAFSSCGKRGPLFIAMRGPFTVAASLVAEHRLQTRRLSSCGSRA